MLRVVTAEHYMPVWPDPWLVGHDGRRCVTACEKQRQGEEAGHGVALFGIVYTLTSPRPTNRHFFKRMTKIAPEYWPVLVPI